MKVLSMGGFFIKIVHVSFYIYHTRIVPAVTDCVYIITNKKKNVHNNKP